MATFTSCSVLSRCCPELPRWLFVPLVQEPGRGEEEEEEEAERKAHLGLPGFTQTLVAPVSSPATSPLFQEGGFVPDGSGLLSITEACLAALGAQSVPVQEVSVISHSSAIWFLMCEAASTQF